MMANTANKTRTCPHCGSRWELFSLRVLAKAEDSRDAVRIIQRLKEKDAETRPEVRFKRFKP
jgi:hypothetical protein